MRKNWEDFTWAVLEFAQHRLGPRIQRRIEVLDRGEETALPPDHLLEKVFGGFTEITNTYEVMQDIELYIRRFPFSGTRVRRSRYLQFHIETYFHETYILRERLVNYAAAIQRLYRKTSQNHVAMKACERAQKIAVGTLEQLTIVRSEHVHQRRFSVESLNHLSGTELIVTNSDESNPDLELWYRYLNWEHKKVRNEWIQTIRGINGTVAELLDVYGSLLYPVLFNQEGQFVHPATVRL